VQLAIDSACVNRTSIIVAHRLSTIINCDQIAVIENGDIVEIGTHSELITRKGIYYKLTEKQKIRQ
jgi:ABC-type multidrug transport system fused ATPase/permease subunit